MRIFHALSGPCGRGVWRRFSKVRDKVSIEIIVKSLSKLRDKPERVARMLVGLEDRDHRKIY